MCGLQSTSPLEFSSFLYSLPGHYLPVFETLHWVGTLGSKGSQGTGKYVNEATFESLSSFTCHLPALYRRRPFRATALSLGKGPELVRRSKWGCAERAYLDSYHVTGALQIELFIGLATQHFIVQGGSSFMTVLTAALATSSVGFLISER